MDKEAIRNLIERYGQSMSAADPPAIAALWEVPAFVMSGQGAAGVSTKGEIEQFYAQNVQNYHSQGLMRILPTVERIEHLGPGVASADVVWSILDADGNEKLTERTRYILRQDSQGEPRIQVVVNKD